VGAQVGEGAATGALVSYYRARRGRGGDGRGNDHQWPKEAPTGLDCIKRGGGLISRNRREIKEEE
jgi:hypothetical protein